MEFANEIDDLANVPVFSGFDYTRLRRLAKCTESRLFLPRDILFREGDASHGSYLIRTGSLNLIRKSADDIPTCVGPGTIVGIKALFLPIYRPATAIANEMTSALFISRLSFQEFLKEDPGAATFLQDMFVEALHEMTREFKLTRINSAA